MGKRTLEAKKACAEWLAQCLKFGWRKDDLDALEAIWWQHRDNRGRLRDCAKEAARG